MTLKIPKTVIRTKKKLLSLLFLNIVANKKSK